MSIPYEVPASAAGNEPPRADPVLAAPTVPAPPVAGAPPPPPAAPRPPAAPAWFERAVSEIIRGRHLILHGNIHDLVYWHGRYLSPEQALIDALTRLGYSTIGRYDQVDGLTVFADDELRRFTELVEEPQQRAAPANTNAPAADPAAGSRGGRSSAIDETLRRAAERAQQPNYNRPADAMAAIRRALAQDREPTAFLVDLADLLLLDPDHHDQSDRQLLAVAKKAMLNSAQVKVLHNTLILLVGELSAIPEWLYRGEPFVQPVEALRPTAEEREAYLHGVTDRFHSGGLLSPAEQTANLRALAHLTDGMATAELDGLWRTSRFEGIPLAEPRELVSRTMFGRRTNPWSALGERAATSAPGRLGAKVLGQPAAVTQVSRALAAATLGIDFVADPHSPEARPKGVFFFVGPTGVGKTELARALSEFVFYDETAMCRFDMSSFSEPHNAERFYGAPPGYVGHERGGELTNRMHQRPFSVLLFDEVEKAHPSIFDKFLQVLEDGRLTDGLGRTAYFSQSLIIFTSNLGADTIYQRAARGELPGYDEVSDHFEAAVREHFTTELRRPELLGRMTSGVGGIVPFDIVRPEHVPAIARKFLAQLVNSSARHSVRLEIDEPSLVALCQRAMSNPATAALGYRQVRAILDRSLRAPLVDALVGTGGGTPATLRAEVRDGHEIATITRL